MITRVKELFNESSKDLKRLLKLVDKVNSAEEKYLNYTDEELKYCTSEFKSQLSQGKTIEHIQADAFAVVREAAKRVIGLRHYDVQLIGGFVLNEGSIAQMNTGEGKTLVATLPSYLQALKGQGVHIITANEYLARRDMELMGQIHEFLGLTVGLNISQMEPSEKKEAYQADITYGTGTEFGFDYLRDNMVFRKEDKVQRGHEFAIVDEVDSILIDEAKTPLIIANQSSDGAELFIITAQIVKSFKKDVDYELFPESRQTFISDEGSRKIETAFGLKNLYDAEHQELLHHVMQSLRASVIMKRDVDYIVKDGKIELIDQFTGRIMEGRSFSEGLHQAIEAKEDLEISEENETHATITIQNYFRLYKNLSGMTGSATPSKREFWDTYNLNVITIPTNKPVRREDYPDLVYRKYNDKLKKIIAEVEKLHNMGRPVLIGTTSIEQSEVLSDSLTKAKIKHYVLNAKTEQDEAEIIARAGQKGQVMLATNMAGRGTDIMLGEDVRELGGLHILGTERNESKRIDMQLRGRSGRQGDAGSSQFIISLEDDLFDYYDEEEKERYLKKVKVDEEGLVVSPDPIKFVKKVQDNIEGAHYSSRIHLLKLENVLDQQSKVIYSMRDRMLELTDGDLFDELLAYMERYMNTLIDQHLPEDPEEHRLGELMEKLSELFIDLSLTEERLIDQDAYQVKQAAASEFNELKQTILELKGDEMLALQLRNYMLTQIDSDWIEHLNLMTQIKEGITLRGYAQEDPYVTFEKEGAAEFNLLIADIEAGISTQFMELIKNDYHVVNENEEGE
ncbi:accessory Sec system translocase SecA2 [Peribacillus psychrosaccharolyticus]|uniref:accessory Sec system translocase SecA2 n=1 Tax=Peribacillus psychrosaccharolyticus TaxID=1407 RepID=UPI003D2914F8